MLKAITWHAAAIPDPAATVTAWYNMMAAYMKSVDPNHMVSALHARHTRTGRGHAWSIIEPCKVVPISCADVERFTQQVRRCIARAQCPCRSVCMGVYICVQQIWGWNMRACRLIDHV